MAKKIVMRKISSTSMNTIYKMIASIIVGVIVIVAVSAFFKSCEKVLEKSQANKELELKVEMEKIKANDPNIIVQPSGSFWEHWITLRKGEVLEIKIPTRLLFEFVAVESNFEVKTDSKDWLVVKDSGQKVDIGETKFVYLRGLEDTKIGYRFSYIQANDWFVKGAYPLR